MTEVRLVQVHKLVNVCQGNGPAAFVDFGELSCESTAKYESKGRIEMSEQAANIRRELSVSIIRLAACYGWESRETEETMPTYY